MPPHERMFHHARAHVLDEAERQQWLPSDDVVRRLAIRADICVADIGAGTGYFALPIARAVGPLGVVYAVDLQPEMLEKLRAKLDPSLPLKLVHGEATRTTLEAGSVDLALLANVWHEIDDRSAALAELARIVRPGGRIAILDWRSDVESPPGPPTAHRISSEETERALAQARWQVRPVQYVGPYEYLLLADARA
jgi:ubiquinone/menaquinone biosynthesis C-methylase UbiE